MNGEADGNTRKRRKSAGHEPSGGDRKEGDEPVSRGPRRFAEWLTFGISLALVLALVAHLLSRLREPVTDAVLAQVSVQLDRVSEQHGRFVLPILVKNPGARTVRDLQVRVEYRERGERRSMDILVDYVGQSAEQVIFAYFRADPRSLSVSAEPITYLVD